MVTTNKRLTKPLGQIINGIDLGGPMTIAIQEGWENIMRSSPDGAQFQQVDKDCQFCRGVIISQDWVHFIGLLTGTIGTYVFYERTSGTAEATGYTKHTLTTPKIWKVDLKFNQKGFATVTAAFECMAADPTKTIVDMHARLPGQAIPTTGISSERGGWRIVSAVYGAINAYHLTDLAFSITLLVSKACNDGDIAYTAVDVHINGMSNSGSIGLQDSSVYQSLLLAEFDDLVVTVRQSGGDADKVLTIANVNFLNVGENSDVNAEYTGYTLAFEVTDDPETPLTLAGTNKILTIA
jgi:hypothetical protein